MKIQIPKKIIVEEYASEYRELVTRLGFIINSFTDDIYNLLQKKVDYNNLNRDIFTLSIQTGLGSEILGSPSLTTSFLNSISGAVILSMKNETNSGIYPTSAPFISWNNTGNTFRILSITGLLPSTRYSITLEIIGN
jgi:hypothetical protein